MKAMYAPFLPRAQKLLSENNVTLTFVDIGSRNGILELASISEFVDAYGFEPNPEEYQKLISGKTDASKFGIQSPRYKKKSYSPYAISDTSGKQKLYVTRGPGATGMLPPDTDRLREIHWKGGVFLKNFAEDIFAIEKVVEVPVLTLREFAKEKSLSHIDYLKIDVEGSEYEVLKGAGELLRSTGVIKVEVCFIPFRKGQKLFSEVDLLLREFGFDLLQYEISPVQIGLKERTKFWSFGPVVGFPERYAQPLQADAIYVNRSLQDRKRGIAQAAVLLEKNYLDEALYILKGKLHLDEPELFSLLKNFNGPWRIRLLNWFFQVARTLVKPRPQNWK